MIETIKALVRPLIAYSLTIGFIYLAIFGQITPLYAGIYGTVAGYYFAQRDSNKKPAQ